MTQDKGQVPDALRLAAQAAYELLSTGQCNIPDQKYCVVTELADALAAPQPALSAGWVNVKDRLPPPFDEVWVHPRPSDYCCEACVDTAGNWKYSEYETNFGVNHIKCDVEYWMQPPPLPPSPPMDGESA